MANPAPDAVLHALRDKASLETPVLPTTDDVRKLHAEHVARFGAGARQSTRTEVHGILQLARPCPAEVPQGSPYRADDLDVVQKHHGMDLWTEADRLVDQALGKVKR